MGEGRGEGSFGFGVKEAAFGESEIDQGLIPRSRHALSALLVVILLSVLNPAPAAPTASNAFPVLIRVDASKTSGALKPIWRFFGADEPNYAYMKNGKKLLAELGELGPKNVFFRAHNLLTSGDGTPALKWGSTGVYSEDAAGQDEDERAAKVHGASKWETSLPTPAPGACPGCDRGRVGAGVGRE